MKYQWVVGGFVVDCAENLDGFLGSVVVIEPAWRLWKAKDEYDHENGEDDLHCDGEAPGNGSGGERHSKVKPARGRSQTDILENF